MQTNRYVYIYCEPLESAPRAASLFASGTKVQCNDEQVSNKIRGMQL